MNDDAQNSPKSILEEAMAEVGLVLKDALDALGMPPVSQDKLREAFTIAMQTPEGIAAFKADVGDAMFTKQMNLARNRTKGITL